MQKDFFNSDEEILNENKNPPLKKRVLKIARKVFSHLIAAGIKTLSDGWKLIPFFIAAKILSSIFNIHPTITF